MFLSFLDSDADLVRKAVAGDSAAFENLVQRYQRKAFAIARAAGAPRDVLEDVVQEAFLRAFRQLASLREPGRFGPWFLTIVRNVVISAARKRRPEDEGELLPASSPAWEESPGEVLEAQELREALWRKVSDLPEGIREAIYLYYHEGESTQAVARALGITSATAKWRLMKGREILRGELWRELRDSLRDLLPSARQWRTMGRRLALAVLATLPPAFGATAAAHAASGGGHFAKATLGGLSMSGKKVGVAVLLALLITAGGAALISLYPGGQRRGEDAASKEGIGRIDSPSGSPGGQKGAAEKARDAAEGIAAGPARPMEPASLSGTVRGAGGEPVARAQVFAIPLDAWNGVAASLKSDPFAVSADRARELRLLREAYLRAASTVPRTESARGGGYEFRRLAAGSYRILAAHPDYIPSSASLVEVQSGAPAYRNVTLAAALSTSGRVVDAAGSPVAGARLEAVSDAEGAMEGSRKPDSLAARWEEGRILLDGEEVLSGPDGGFRLGSLEPAAYDLTARKEGWIEARAFAVPAGSRGIVLSLEDGAIVAGRVVDPEGKPVAGARVTLDPAPDFEVHKLFDWRRLDLEGPETRKREAKTGADGRFEIGGLGEGGFGLVVAAENFPRLKRDVTIAEHRMDLGDLALEAPRTIAGVVLGPDGDPVARARVWVPRPTRRVATANSITLTESEAAVETKTAGDGSFLLEGLPAGLHEVRASSELHADGDLRGIEAGARGVTVRLKAGIEIAGKVVDDETSSPVPGTEVRIGLRGEKTALSGSDGSFLIRGLPVSALHNGWTAVRAHHPEYGLFSDYNVSVLGRNSRSPLIIRLSRSQNLTGWVRDARGGGVARAAVSYEVIGLPAEAMGYNPLAGVRTRSTADGSFSLPAPSSLRSLIGDPRLFVVASHPTEGSARVGPLDLAPTGRNWPEVVAVLSAGGAIEGTVLDAAERPVAGARLLVRPLAPPEWEGPDGGARAEFVGMARSAYAGADGSYRVAGVEPGAVMVTASALGHATRTLDGIRLGNEALRLDITLEAGASVDGGVVDGEGNPVAGAEVAAFPKVPARQGGESRRAASEFLLRMSRLEKRGLASARTDAGGRYRIDHLPEGAYTIVARAEGFEAAASEDARPGGAPVDFILERFAAVQGTVLDAESRRPIALFEVDVLDRKKLPGASPERGRAFISDYRVASEGELRFEDPSGRFVYDGLRPGNYTLVVKAQGYDFSLEEVTIQGGKVGVVEVLLSRGSQIAGVVLDAETGQPISAVQVGCFEQLSSPGDRGITPFREGIVTGENGAFTISGLKAGKYHLGASHPLYDRGSAPIVEIPAADGAPIELKLKPAGRIEGRIRGLTNLHGIKRRLNHSLDLHRVEPDEREPKGRSGRRYGMPIHMDPQGNFRADSLAPGKYRLDLKKQEVEQGEVVHLGPSGGYSSDKPVGPEEIIPLGELEVRPGETTTFDAAAP